MNRHGLQARPELSADIVWFSYTVMSMFLERSTQRAQTSTEAAVILTVT